jgi:hypothetical protein
MQQLLIYGHNFMMDRKLQLLYAMWAIPVYAYSQAHGIPKGRNPELLGLAITQAMRYLIYIGTTLIHCH